MKRMKAVLDFNPRAADRSNVPLQDQLPFRKGDVLKINLSDVRRGDGLVKAQVTTAILSPCLETYFKDVF